MIRQLVAAATAIVLVAGLASSASAFRPNYYLALGDSIATGRQADPVTPNQGYVARLSREDRSLRLVNLACDGETTASMRAVGRCGRNQVAEALDFLRKNKGRVRLITITVGGNDTTPCATPGAIDPDCVTNALAAINTNLTRTMTELRAAAPWVKIVGMTLYNPFLAAFLTGPEGQEFARQSIPVAQTVNRTLAAAYRSVGAKVADVETAFSTTDLTTTITVPEFGELPLAVARICQWTTMCRAVPDVHPNTPGYAVIADTYRPLI